MAKNAVVVKFLADIDGLKKGVDGINKQLSGFGKFMKGFGLTLAAAFSTQAITNFAKEAIGAASDLEESYSKVGAVFKNNADEVKNWAESSVTQFGLSKQAALEAAGTFGNLFTAFGVATDDAAKMSTALTELAADLASFNNTSIQEAITALRSGLSGETEPLKRFGVALSQAAIEAEALAMGLISSGDELTQAAKTQAIYALVMKQTTNAQGDFLRTQDGLANTTRTLEAAFDDAKATIGQGFLDAILSVSEELGGPNGMASVIDDTATSIGDFVIGIGLGIDELLTFNDTIKDATDNVISLGKVWRFGLAIGTAGLSESVLFASKKLMEQGEAARETKEEIELWDKASRIAANNMRGKLVPDTLKAKAAAKELEDQALQTASAIRAMTGAGSTPENSRAVRNMDAIGRSLDKNSIYWKNAAEEAGDYFRSLEEISGGGSSGRSPLKEIEEETIKWAKASEGSFEIVSDGLDDYVLHLGNVGKKAVKLTKDQTEAIKEQALGAVQDILDAIAESEKQMAETAKFIAQQTANFLGPTNIKSVQQAYAAAKSEAAQLERAYERAKEARLKAEGNKESAEAIKALRIAENEAQKAAQDASANAARGFEAFWADAQAAVVAYRGELDRLRESFAADGVITEAEAKIFQDVFSLPPDTGTQLINDLLTETGKALTDNQQQIIDDTKDWMVVITDTFAGQNGYPAVGLTAATQTRDDFIAQLTSKDSKKKIKEAVRKAVPKKVKVRVEWDYDPFTPNIPSSIAPAGSRAVTEIQEYERRNGTKWRSRVR